MYQEIHNELNYRAADKLPAPKTVAEICVLGIEDPDLATNCIAEALD